MAYFGEFNVEVRQDGRWVRLPDQLVPCAYCYGKGTQPADGPIPASSDRCSECVGSGVGVASLYRGLPWYHVDFRLDAEGRARRNLIASPRGLPADAARETVAAIKMAQRSMGADEASWLSLQELLAYDWDQRVERSGWLPLRDYPRFLEVGAPEEWGTWSRDQLEASSVGHTFVDEAEARRLVAEDHELLHVHEPADIFVRVEWTEAYAETAREFVGFVHAELAALGDPENVRIVFVT